MHSINQLNAGKSSMILKSAKKLKTSLGKNRMSLTLIVELCLRRLLFIQCVKLFAPISVWPLYGRILTKKIIKLP